MYKEYFPKIWLCLRSNYNLEIFKKDLIAGLTVGIVAFPLAIAFAIASGVTPVQGLITAIIAGFCISAFGGSRVQIGGPTGAFVVLIYGIIQRTGYEGLAISTLIAALILIFFGVCKIGSWIKYIPTSLITGFTTGIAVLIFSSQVKDFLGFGEVPCSFLGKWSVYLSCFSSCSIPAISLGLGTLVLIALLRKFIPKAPWAIIAIGLATLTACFLDLPIETIKTRFGGISSTIPSPSFPSLNLIHGNLTEFFFDGIAIALLGGIESLLSAVIGDGMVGSRHKSNTELVGQGIANFFSVIFGGIPATGAIARTAMNVKSGAKTPVAGIIHAFTLLGILLFCAPFANQMPLAALSAVLIVVAWNMSEYKHFFSLLKAPLSDVIILLSSFFLTIFVDITISICFGMVLSCLFFMKKMSDLSTTTSLKRIFIESEYKELDLPTFPSEVEVYEVQGPFFFGSANILREVLSHIEKHPKFFILRMRNTLFIDASGMQALVEFYQSCVALRTELFLSEIPEGVKKDLHKFGFFRTLKKENCFESLDKALAAAK